MKTYAYIPEMRVVASWETTTLNRLQRDNLDNWSVLTHLLALEEKNTVTLAESIELRGELPEVEDGTVGPGSISSRAA